MAKNHNSAPKNPDAKKYAPSITDGKRTLKVGQLIDFGGGQTTAAGKYPISKIFQEAGKWTIVLDLGKSKIVEYEPEDLDLEGKITTGEALSSGASEVRIGDQTLKAGEAYPTESNSAISLALRAKNFFNTPEGKNDTFKLLQIEQQKGPQGKPGGKKMIFYSGLTRSIKEVTPRQLQLALLIANEDVRAIEKEKKEIADKKELPATGKLQLNVGQKIAGGGELSRELAKGIQNRNFDQKNWKDYSWEITNIGNDGQSIRINAFNEKGEVAFSNESVNLGDLKNVINRIELPNVVGVQTVEVPGKEKDATSFLNIGDKISFKEKDAEHKDVINSFEISGFINHGLKTETAISFKPNQDGTTHENITTENLTELIESKKASATNPLIETEKDINEKISYDKNELGNPAKPEDPVYKSVNIEEPMSYALSELPKALGNVAEFVQKPEVSFDGARIFFHAKIVLKKDVWLGKTIVDVRGTITVGEDGHLHVEQNTMSVTSNKEDRDGEFRQKIKSAMGANWSYISDEAEYRIRQAASAGENILDYQKGGLRISAGDKAVLVERMSEKDAKQAKEKKLAQQIESLEKVSALVDERTKAFDETLVKPEPVIGTPERDVWAKDVEAAKNFRNNPIEFIRNEITAKIAKLESSLKKSKSATKKDEIQKEIGAEKAKLIPVYEYLLRLEKDKIGNLPEGTPEANRTMITLQIGEIEKRLYDLGVVASDGEEAVPENSTFVSPDDTVDDDHSRYMPKSTPTTVENKEKNSVWYAGSGLDRHFGFPDYTLDEESGETSYYKITVDATDPTKATFEFLSTPHNVSMVSLMPAYTLTNKGSLRNPEKTDTQNARTVEKGELKFNPTSGIWEVTKKLVVELL